jgi:COP9 signalosome complex subunit 1
MEIAPLDVGWVEEVTNTNQADKSKLEVELRNYSSNMIKESIRVSNNERPY